MQYRSHYVSPLGTILLFGDETTLSGLYFDGQKNYPFEKEKKLFEKETEPLKQAKKWLDIYFTGRNPEFTVPCFIEGSEFQMLVWDTLSTVPYGSTVTYQYIAKKIGKPKAVRAIAGAISKNPISILIPCHRVIHSNGDIKGYAGGNERKKYLIELEKNEPLS